MADKEAKVLTTPKAIKWMEDNYALASYVKNKDNKMEWEVYWWIDKFILCTAGETLEKAVSAAKHCTDNYGDGENEVLTQYLKWKSEEFISSLMKEKKAA